jgi:hypothetical protein
MRKEDKMIKRETFGNPNVSKGANVIGSKRFISGEIVTTYYVLNGKLFRVDDWTMSRPEKADWEEVNGMD